MNDNPAQVPGQPPRPDPPMKPGPQPWNRIGSLDEQIRRATTPRVVEEVVSARAELDRVIRALLAIDRRLGHAIVRG